MNTKISHLTSLKFRVAGYLGIANTAHLRVFIEKVKPTLEQWASIREGFENFPSYAGADLFDWLNGVEKPSGLDVRQQLPLSNYEEVKLYATTTLCTMYRLLSHGEISLDAVQGEEVNYFDFTPEDWYRAFCLLRYYWRERTREGQEGDGTSKKQNITAEPLTYFDERQLRDFRQNPPDALREPGAPKLTSNHISRLQKLNLID